jgi:hypothetical protein
MGPPAAATGQGYRHGITIKFTGAARKTYRETGTGGCRVQCNALLGCPATGCAAECLHFAK